MRVAGDRAIDLAGKARIRIGRCLGGALAAGPQRDGAVQLAGRVLRRLQDHGSEGVKKMGIVERVAEDSVMKKDAAE